MDSRMHHHRHLLGWHQWGYIWILQRVRMVLQGIECLWLSILLVPCVVIDKIYVIY